MYLQYMQVRQGMPDGTTGYTQLCLTYTPSAVDRLIDHCLLRMQAGLKSTLRPAYSIVESFCPLLLIQEKQVVRLWRKNRQLILVNCIQEACPGTMWFSY